MASRAQERLLRSEAGCRHRLRRWVYAIASLTMRAANPAGALFIPCFNDVNDITPMESTYLVGLLTRRRFHEVFSNY